MSDLICPFSAPLVKQNFACQNAKEIIRRGGAEVACVQPQAHIMCTELHGTIKASALAAMGYEDDLTTLPHNVLVKIQYGGLLSLQNVLSGNEQTEKIEDISKLVADVIQQFTTLDDLPFDVINKCIIDYKAKRRGKK